MQYSLDKYDEQQHEKYQCLVLPQPSASNLISKLSNFEDGTSHGHKSVVFLDEQIDYRGEILICSTEKPNVHGLECGATLGFVQLVDVKHASLFTEEDWDRADVAENKRKAYKDSFGLFLINPERIVEFPFNGNPGFYEMVYTRDVLIKYPTTIHVDMKGIKKAQENEKNRTKH